MTFPPHMPTITLFQFEDCPFCAKVRARLDTLGLSCQKLVTTTRQRRVACSPLRGSGHSLFEHISYRFTPPAIDWRYKMYEKVDVSRDRNDPLRKELYRRSGVPTVPVLRIDDIYIGDSEEIIKHIEERFT